MNISQLTPLAVNQMVGTNSNQKISEIQAENIQFSQLLDEATQRLDEAQTPSAHVKTPEELEEEARQLRDAAQQFEAMFLNLMWQEMRKTVPKDELIGNSNAIDIFQEMHDSEVMKDISKAGGIGIADMMVQQLSPKNNVRYE